MIKRIGQTRKAIAHGVGSFTDSVEEFWSAAKQSVVSLAGRVWAVLLQGMKFIPGLAQRVWSAIVRLLKLVGTLAKWVWNAIAHWLSPIAGAGLLVAGVIVGIYGLLRLYPKGWLFEDVVKDFYANASTELISIAITVLIIDYLNSLRQDRQLRAQLVRDLGGKVEDFSFRALRELAHHNWLYDGSLKGADLRGANLEGANLEGANLEGARLYEANLSDANLGETNLRGASLGSANLKKANLLDADLRGADLRGAKLEGANLGVADLRGAKLERANLVGAYLRQADLRGADLKRA